jgi:NADH dehydrogenase (ubiquinone) 1 alpha subcomplex subunit 6
MSKMIKNFLITTNKRNYSIVQRSSSKEEARVRVLSLYKRTLKEIPWMRQTFHLFGTKKDMNEKIRREFLKHKTVKDLFVIDSLIFKGYNDLEEVLQHHMQRGYVMQFFKPDDITNKESPFLKEFFEKKNFFIRGENLEN